MYGWRARIGYISAGTGEVVSEELFRVSPKGVEVLYGNLLLEENALSDHKMARNSLKEMAQRITQKAEVDILVIAGYLLPTLGKGDKVESTLSLDQELVHLLEDLTKRPVITGIRAQVEAMQAFKVKCPIVIVPGPIEAFSGLKEYLQGKGFEIGSFHGMPISGYGEPYCVPLHISYRFVKEAFLKCPGGDAILFPESSFPAAPNVRILEQDLGVPVFLDSFCCLWSCLRQMHIGEFPSGWGSLFEKLHF